MNPIIRTNNDALNFLEGRLAYLKTLSPIDVAATRGCRSEIDRLERLLGPVEGRRKAPSFIDHYADRYAGRDVYVPRGFLPYDAA